MRPLPSTLLMLCFALMSGCAAKPQAESQQSPPQAIKIVRVPIYVVPNCNLPVAHACQWIEPPANAVAEPVMPQRVKGIAL
jgi:hypothetical protein